MPVHPPRPCSGWLAQRVDEAARRKVQGEFNEEFVVQAYLDVLARLDAVKPGN